MTDTMAGASAPARSAEWKATEEALWAAVVSAGTPLDKELASRAYVDHHLPIHHDNPRT